MTHHVIAIFADNIHGPNVVWDFSGTTDNNHTVPSNVVEKTSLDTATTVASTSLSSARSLPCCVGDLTHAIIAEGDDGSGNGLTFNFVYATETYGSSVDLDVPSYRVAQGNITAGYFGKGYPPVNSERYHLTTDALSAGPGINDPGSASGGVDIGLWVAGEQTGKTDTRRHTYATEALSGGSAFWAPVKWHCGTSNVGNAYHGCGHGGGFFGEETRIDRYNIAGNTWTEAGELFGEVGELGLTHATAAGNKILSIWSGGQQTGSVLGVKYKYTYADEVSITWSSQITDRTCSTSVCGNPGHYIGAVA